MGTRTVSLYVNDAPVETDYFVQRYIDHVTGGIIAALSGTGPIRSVDLCIERDTVAIELNGEAVPLNPFVNAIVRQTVEGMVSSLKGVAEMRAVRISLSRQ